MGSGGRDMQFASGGFSCLEGSTGHKTNWGLKRKGKRKKEKYKFKQNTGIKESQGWSALILSFLLSSSLFLFFCINYYYFLANIIIIFTIQPHSSFDNNWFRSQVEKFDADRWSNHKAIEGGNGFELQLWLKQHMLKAFCLF